MGPLSPDLLQKMDAYWRAANYLAVGQIYLYENPLLRVPLKPEHLAVIKAALVGVAREGTSAAAFRNTRYVSAGKTGTAQVYSLKGAEYKAHLVDERMRDVPDDGRTPGEIVVRSNVVMEGYYKVPRASTFDAERNINKLPPSEYFKTNVFFTYQDDRAGVLTTSVYGEDNFLWASDYPHGVTTWPYSKETVDRNCEGIDPAVKRKINRDNTAKLYRLDL